MKKTLITLCLSLYCVVAFAQSFTGTVVYNNTFKSKIQQATDQQFSDMMGSTQTWVTDGVTYRADMNGSLMQWQLYVPADGKLYTKMSNSPEAIWNDVTVNPDEVLSSEIHPGVAEVLGYKCDELILNCKTGVQKYYFSSKLSLDDKAYTKHQYGNWYAYLSKAHAVPLKIIIDSQQFSMESVATSVKPGMPEKNLFALPAGLVTTKSPF